MMISDETGNSMISGKTGWTKTGTEDIGSSSREYGGHRHLIDLIHEDPDVTITALFGPEHGIRGHADAGEPVGDSTDELTGAPVYSLYGENRRPTMDMLGDVDVLIFDMQDVGARFYTYPVTMGRSMISAAEAGIPFLVLDRPIPLGGVRIEVFYNALPKEDRGGFFNERGMQVRAGNELVQQMLEQGEGAQAVIELWKKDVEEFTRQREP